MMQLDNGTMKPIDQKEFAKLLGLGEEKELVERLAYKIFGEVLPGRVLDNFIGN